MNTTNLQKKLTFNQTDFEGKFAAIYVRVSSNDLKQTSKANKERKYRESVKTQESDGVKHAHSKGWQYRVFTGDCNISGFCDDVKRKDLNEILNLMKSGQIHTLIARDPYRISRNASLSSDILYKYLLKYGVNLILTDLPIDISTPEGQDTYINFGLKGQGQLQYTSRISLRNKRSLAESGGYSCKPPYGWRMASRDRNDVEQVPDEVIMVKRVFQEYSGGKSISQIVEGMKRDGIKRRLAQDTDWSIGDIGRMLRRVQYIGKIRFQKKVYPSPYTSIIDLTTWQTVQDRLKYNENRGQREKTSWALASGLMRCGLCEDRKAAGGTVRFGNLHIYRAMSYGGKKPIVYFRCGEQMRYRARTCPGGNSIPVIVIDDFIKRIITYYAVNGVNDNINTSLLDEEIAKEEKEIAKLTRTKESLISTFIAAEGSPTDLAKVTRKINVAIDASIRKIEERRTRIEAISNKDAAHAVDRLTLWDSLETQVKRDLLKKVIDRIVVYPDRLRLFTRMNPTQAAIFEIKRVRGSKVIIANELDHSAMGWQVAVNFASEIDIPA